MSKQMQFNVVVPSVGLINVKPESTVVFKPRPYQKKAFKKVAAAIHRILNMPTGAGKSLVIKMLAVTDQNADRTPVIVVPRCSIGTGFTKSDNPCTIRIGRKNETFEIHDKFDLIHGEQKLSKKTDNAIRHLESGSTEAIIMTHTTWCNTYRELEARDELQLLDNVSLFVDEAHHSSQGEDDYDTNVLGESIAKTMTTGKVTMVTATFFRGDKVEVLNDINADRFTKYDLPYDEYIKQMAYLKNIEMSILTFNSSNTAAQVVAKELNPLGHSIVYVPQSSSNDYGHMGYSPMGKVGKIELVEDIHACVSPSNWYPTEDGYWYSTYKCNNILLVDLIDDSIDRGPALRYLTEHGREEDCPNIVTAMSMVKEGTDVPKLDSVFIIGHRKSLGDTLQMIGRALRDLPGKDTVKVYFVIPDYNLKDDVTTGANNYIKSLVMTMMLEDVIAPRLTKGAKRASGSTALEDLIENLGSETAAIDLKNDLMTQAIKSGASDLSEVSELVEQMLTDRGIDDPKLAAKLAKKVVRETSDKLVNRIALDKGIDVSSVDIQMVKDMGFFEQVKYLVSKGITSKVFDEFRDHLRGGELAAIERVIKVCVHIDANPDFRSRGEKNEPGNISIMNTINAYRRSKAGILRPGKTTTEVIWYPVLDKVAEDAGYPGLFDRRSDGEQRAIGTATKLFDTLNSLEKTVSGDKVHGLFTVNPTLSNFVYSMRGAKAGRSFTTSVWYPILDKMASDAGYPDIFNLVDGEQVAINKANSILANLSENGTVSKGKLAAALNGLRRVKAGYKDKNGRSAGIWYPILDKMASDAGYPKLFDQIDLEQLTVDKVNAMFKWMKEHGVITPATNSSMCNLLYKLRGSRANRKNSTPWYPILDKIADDAGYPDIFKPIDKQKLVINSANEIFEWMKQYGALTRATNDALYSRLNRLRCARAGTLTAGLWFPILDKLAADVGFPDIFKKVRKNKVKK